MSGGEQKWQKTFRSDLEALGDLLELHCSQSQQDKQNELCQKNRFMTVTVS